MTSDDQRFIEHLESASRIVSRWPKWKQSVLGGLEVVDDGWSEDLYVALKAVEDDVEAMENGEESA